MRHLVGRELAEEDRAGVVELAHGRGVLARGAVDEDARMTGSENAAGVVDVLESERDAVQRAAVLARRDLRLGRARLASRELEGRRDERACLAVEVFDAADQ